MKCKSKRKCRFLILVLGAVFLPAVVFCRFSKLERAFPVDQRFELIEFRARDKGNAPPNFAGWDRRFSCREYLQSLRRRRIVVNGKILPIDPTVFATSGNRGTIIDSGTNLVYLAADAYDPFVNAVHCRFAFQDRLQFAITF